MNKNITVVTSSYCEIGMYVPCKLMYVTLDKCYVKNATFHVFNNWTYNGGKVSEKLKHTVSLVYWTSDEQRRKVIHLYLHLMEKTHQCCSARNL